MAKAKKKVATPKNPRSRTVYAYWPTTEMDDTMMTSILDSFYDNPNEAKEEAISDASSPAYLYQVTVTRIAKGERLPFSWTKE